MVAVTIVLLMTIPTAFLIIYMEMKIIALMNLRIGPDRVGPFGSLLSVVHGLKVLMKEDFTPTGADSVVFTWAPVVTYLASVMTLLVIPFAPGLFGQDLNIGLLYFFAIGGLSVVGLLMAGWSSYNKYSLLGGLRSAAQVISYEIPLTLSVVGLILLAGTMSLNQIVENQAGWFTDWYVFQQPLGVLIFFIAATAEANRTPFDLTEADSEIVAGFATEYSGMRFGFFFFAEYVNVFIISALTVTLFFGGWNAPFPWPWPVELSLNPGQLGIGLLLLVAIVPLILTLVVRGADLDRQRTDQGLAGAARRLRAGQPLRRDRDPGDRLHRARLGRGAALVPAQDLRVRVHLRLDARDAAAGADRPAHGLRLEVDAAGIAAQPVRDGGRDRRLQHGEAAPDERLRARPRHRQGHGADPAPLLRAQGHDHVPGGSASSRRPSSAAACSCSTTSGARSSARPASSAPRPARSSASTWAGSTPAAATTSTGARPRHTASGARNLRCGAPGGPCRTRRTGRSRAVDLAPLDAILDDFDHDPEHMLEILEATQAAYGYLPVAALKRISQLTGAWYAMIYGTATYYSHLRFEPAEATVQAAAVDAHRPPEETLHRRARRDALAGAPRRGRKPARA